MVDLSGKYISTENNAESGRILKMAISQGYKSSIGVKALENCRLFHFSGTPYKSITVPELHIKSEKIIRYSDLCGNEREELEKIVDLAMRWCRAHGYSHLAVFANDEDESFTGQGMANSEDGMRQHVKSRLQKPMKVSIEDIEKKYGCPIEIVEQEKFQF